MLKRGPKGRDHLGDPDVDGRSVLRWILRYGVCRCKLDLTGVTRFQGFARYLMFQKGTMFRTLHLLSKSRVLFKTPDGGQNPET
jgi:hypothetical protein